MFNTIACRRNEQGKANHEPLQDKQWNDEIERTATTPEQQT
jgi:hypothetical protein